MDLPLATGHLRQLPPIIIPRVPDLRTKRAKNLPLVEEVEPKFNPGARGSWAVARRDEDGNRWTVVNLSDYVTDLLGPKSFGQQQQQQQPVPQPHHPSPRERAPNQSQQLSDKRSPMIDPFGTRRDENDAEMCSPYAGA
ncbi:ATP-dependent RNA helicase DHX29 [Anopheles sinensis]|uniref:ATP-dependent RNA helicase DHX29 n=1 Tax=Anopheles sinensis TaxID=74873 RepID=A0A084VE24_ANOSI|nr:ATP-dependent RNA helicase DHX29 [Anopheles sinensis]